MQTLVIYEGFQQSGRICANCDYLTLRDSDACPVCGGETRVLEDIVEHVVHRAIDTDVEVAFVQDDRLARAGSIGSLWRF